MIWIQYNENFVNNFSFLVLLFSMIFYWVRTFSNISIFHFLGKLSLIGSNISMFFLLTYRGFIENHFPLSNRVTRKYIHKKFS